MVSVVEVLHGYTLTYSAESVAELMELVTRYEAYRRERRATPSQPATRTVPVSNKHQAPAVKTWPTPPAGAPQPPNGSAVTFGIGIELPTEDDA